MQLEQMKGGRQVRNINMNNKGRSSVNTRGRQTARSIGNVLRVGLIIAYSNDQIFDVRGLVREKKDIHGSKTSLLKFCGIPRT